MYRIALSVGTDMLETIVQSRRRRGRGLKVADRSYEAALEILSEAARCFKELVRREEAKSCPDRQAIAHWSAGAWWCLQERHDLRPDDSYEVARVRRQWEQFVRRSREELADHTDVA